MPGDLALAGLAKIYELALSARHAAGLYHAQCEQRLVALKSLQTRCLHRIAFSKVVDHGLDRLTQLDRVPHGLQEPAV